MGMIIMEYSGEYDHVSDIIIKFINHFYLLLISEMD